MTARRATAPRWFELLIAALLLWGLYWSRQIELAALAPGDAPPPALAFWAAIATIASVIWKGLQVAAQVTIKFLAWAVGVLWTFAGTVYHALIDVGQVIWAGFKQAWKYLQLTYTKVLKPAWIKFFKLVDRLEKWLNKIFGPTLRFLGTLRREFLKFYEKWVRPILDVIGIARKVSRVLSSLGLEWARALDRRLGELEEKIDRPFRFVLAKINEVINVVNRVVTADGLFQRLALLRSVERDMVYISRSFWRGNVREPTEDDLRKSRESPEEKTPQQHAAEAIAMIQRTGGPRMAYAEEIAGSLARMLLAR